MGLAEQLQPMTFWRAMTKMRGSGFADEMMAGNSETISNVHSQRNNVKSLFSRALHYNKADFEGALCFCIAFLVALRRKLCALIACKA